MIGTNVITRAPVTPKNSWELLLVCLLNDLKEKYKARLVVFCTVQQNPEVGTAVANFLKGNVAGLNEMIPNLVSSNPGELQLMDLENTLRITGHLALTRDRIHFS